MGNIDNKVVLTLVRELGFNNVMGVNRTPTEEVFFLGPCLSDGTQEKSFNVTDEAILEFIAHCEHQAQIAKDYLANHKNNKTHEWQPVENRCASCGSTNPERWPVVQYGGQNYPCPNKAFHNPTAL